MGMMEISSSGAAAPMKGAIPRAAEHMEAGVISCLINPKLCWKFSHHRHLQNSFFNVDSPLSWNTTVLKSLVCYRNSLLPVFCRICTNFTSLSPLLFCWTKWQGFSKLCRGTQVYPHIVWSDKHCFFWKAGWKLNPELRTAAFHFPSSAADFWKW